MNKIKVFSWLIFLSFFSVGVKAQVPTSPTIRYAVAGDGYALIYFNPPVSFGTGATSITSYTVTSIGGKTSLFASGSASPIRIIGLTNGTSYTFTVTAKNNLSSTGYASLASNGVKPSNGVIDSVFSVSARSTLASSNNALIKSPVLLYGIASPGNTPYTATLNTGAFTFTPFSTYKFDISNTTGTAGSSSGWDLINSSGSISFTTTGMTILDITAPSSVTGFSSTNAYSWTIAKGSSIKGFNSSNFTLLTANFQPQFTGTFSVVQSGNNINLVYTPNPLPITFVNISATQNNGGVAINWTVSNELNIANYSIERSIDAVHFIQIAQTKATGVNNYSIEDLNPSGNTIYYRIKSMENDGKSYYCKITKLITHHSSLITIYPNPVHDNLSITLSSVTNGTYKVRLTTITGIEIFTNKKIVANGNMLTINTSSIANGLYVIELTDENGNKQIGKFVKK